MLYWAFLFFFGPKGWACEWPYQYIMIESRFFSSEGGLRKLVDSVMPQIWGSIDQPSTREKPVNIT